jgi:Transglycosylase SLT domain
MHGNLRRLGTGAPDRWTGAHAFGLRIILIGNVLAAAAGLITPAAVHGADQVASQPEPRVNAVDAERPPEQLGATDAPGAADGQGPSFRAAVRSMLEQEVRKTGLPADIADAVVQIESHYDPSVVGRVGEIGLMQIRPGTAAMLGFRGSAEELAKPETNIHYGVTYLSQAWRLANGDLCRTLMKYRAGHGEEVMTPRSVNYCNRARRHMAALGSPLATGEAPPSSIIPASVLAPASPKLLLTSPIDVYAQYRQGTPAASRAFWAVHEARIRTITARIEARWHRVSSR